MLQTLQVSEFLTLVNQTLRTIPNEQFFVEGEVSDYRIAQNKWISFDLKDEEEQAVLKCFMTAWQMSVPLEDGMRIRVQGYAKIYERFGTFKLNIQNYEPVGEGALRKAYELLKKKLEGEGLFELDRKRSLPRFISRVGLITSRDAAARGDFLQILDNRFGGVEVDFTHTQVQGKEAVPTILNAFAYFNQLSESERPDVLVLIRGGGGLEDLHAFNDEGVARAVFQSKIPVVCGVGHERDESLCDFVADIRASTPSNAAERIVPNRSDVVYEIDNMSHFMGDRLGDWLIARRQILENAARAIGFLIDRQKERLNTNLSQLVYRSEQWFLRLKESVESDLRILTQLDPKRVLSRGYSIVKSKKGVVKNINELDIGDGINVQLSEGSFDAEVRRVGDKGQEKLL